MSKPSIPTSSLPWLAAMLLGATAHVGWLAHELTRADPIVRVVTVPGPPQAIRVSVAPPEKPCSGARTRREGLPARGHDVEATDAWPQLDCSDGAECVMGRELVETLMHDPARLAKEARIVPSARDGETIGFKLYGILRGSVTRALGFHNGDLLTAVNGQPLASIDDLMQAYTTLRSEDSFRVELLRKGEALTKVIRIQ